MGLAWGAPVVPADQLASLKVSMAELEAEPDGYDQLVRAWLDGDTAKLDREALEPLRAASPTLYRRLVSERNAAGMRALGGGRR